MDTIMQTVMNLAKSRSTELELGPDVSLRDAGIDSLALVGLILDLENEFGVKIPAELMTPDSFHSPRTIARCLQAVVDAADRQHH